MTSRIRNITGILVLSFNALLAQTAPVSYNAFMALLENHPRNAVSQQWQQMAHSILISGRGQFDPVLSGETEQKQWMQKTSYQWIRTEAKQNIFAGHSLKAGFDYGQGSFVNPEFQTPALGIPYAGIELALGQGLIMDKRRADYLKSKAYGNLYTLSAQQEKNELLNSASQTYVQWLNFKAQLDIMYYFNKLAQDRLSALKHAQQTGEKSVMDTVEASIYLQGRTLEVQEAQLALNQIQNYLSTFIWSSTGLLIDSTLLANNTDVLQGVLQQAMRIKSNVSTDSLNAPEINRYAVKSKLLDIELQYRKEFLKPTLNVRYNVLSSGIQAFNAQQLKWSAQLAFPLFFRTPLGEYRVVKSQLQQNILEGTQKRAEWLAKINALDFKLKRMANQIITAQQASTLSKTLLEAEQIKFQNGEGTLFLLNSRENKWLENQLKLTELQAKWLQVYFEWVYAHGHLNYKL